MQDSNSEDKPMVEDHLDCAGKTRTFKISVYAAGHFLEAAELRRGEPTGIRFVLPIKSGELPPWGEIRDKIRKRLSQRDLVRDKDGNLRDLQRIVRAQITDTGRVDQGTPLLLVDDLQITWEELGRMLMTYSGWGLRLEIRDCGDE